MIVEKLYYKKINNQFNLTPQELFERLIYPANFITLKFLIKNLNF